jgi:hypothetical protein
MRNSKNGKYKKPTPPLDSVDDSAVQEYARSFSAWQAKARKVLAAQKLMKLTGGYEEALVLLDGFMFSETDAMLGTDPSAGSAKNHAKDTADEENANEILPWEATARQVLAAQKLWRLAGSYEEAFLLLDAVLIATEGQQAHQKAAERRLVCARHHQSLAEKEELAKRGNRSVRDPLKYRILDSE